MKKTEPKKTEPKNRGLQNIKASLKKSNTPAARKILADLERMDELGRRNEGTCLPAKAHVFDIVEARHVIYCP